MSQTEALETLYLVTENSSEGPPSYTESKGPDKFRVSTFSVTSNVNHAISIKCSAGRPGNDLGSKVS